MTNRSWIFAVLGVVIALASFTWTVLHADHPALSVTATSSISVVQLGSNEASDISVLYRDRPVKNLSKLVITVKNSGNRPLAPEDFTQPIRLEMPVKADLLAANVEDRRPRSLIGTIISEPNGRSIRLQPELLNPGDELDVALYLTSDLSDLPQVSGRIKGVSEISMTDTRSGAREKQKGSQAEAEQNPAASQDDVSALDVLFGLGIIWLLGLGIIAAIRGTVRAFTLWHSLQEISAELVSSQNCQQLANCIRRHLLINLVDDKLEQSLLEQAKSDEPVEVTAGRMAMLLRERIRTALLTQVTLSMVALGSFFIVSWGFMENIFSKI